jgi:PhzF family phenazine biosynthesis protein
MIGIKSRNKLNSLKPDFHALTHISGEIKCNGYFIFTFNTGDKNILTCSRMFAPAIGINEDPVTGNANGPLAGYLIQNKIVITNGSIFEFNGMQGEAVNRKGIINVKAEIENGRPALIQIKGDAVVIFRTEIEI